MCSLNTGSIKCIAKTVTSLANGWIAIPKTDLGIEPIRVISVVANSYVVPYSIRDSELIGIIMNAVGGTNIIPVPNSTTTLRIYYI